MIIPFYDTTVIPSGSWDLETGYEDAWSTTKGYPKSGAFHEGRLYIGGSKSLPANVWGSRVGQFFNFDPGQALDDEGLSFTIQDDQVANVINTVSQRNLIFLTGNAEYFVPKSVESPLTPSNFRIERATSRGSKPRCCASWSSWEAEG